MGIYSRLIKTIFLVLGVYLIIINIAIWALDFNFLEDSILNNYYVSQDLTFSQFHTGYSSNRGYMPTQWFFDKLSTYPGLYMIIDSVNKYASILSSFNSNPSVLEVLLAIFWVLFYPLYFGICVFMDILNNAIWFLGFIFW